MVMLGSLFALMFLLLVAFGLVFFAGVIIYIAEDRSYKIEISRANKAGLRERKEIEKFVRKNQRESLKIARHMIRTTGY